VIYDDDEARTSIASCQGKSRRLVGCNQATRIRHARPLPDCCPRRHFTRVQSAAGGHGGRSVQWTARDD
jgi:hypothetical protein